MKMMLKVLALPVLFVVKSICILGNLLTNISSYVIGLLLLVIAGCAIYCIVQAMWTSLAILAGMGLAAFLLLFTVVFLTVQIENASKNFMCFSISRGVKSEVSEIATNPYSGTLLGDGKVWFMIIGSALIVGAIIFGFETKRKKKKVTNEK